MSDFSRDLSTSPGVTVELTPGQLRTYAAILHQYVQEGRCGVRSLCERLGFASPNAVTRQLDILERAGWIRRDRGPGGKNFANGIVPLMRMLFFGNNEGNDDAVLVDQATE